MRLMRFKLLIAAVLYALVAGDFSDGPRGSGQQDVARSRRGYYSPNCDSNVTISSLSDVDYISNCTIFQSSLTILGPEVVFLPNLEVLRGDLILNSSSQVVSFTADSLTEITSRGYSYGINIQSPPKLKTLSFKSLGNITGQLYIINASSLAYLDLPALVNVTARTLIAQTGLRALELPAFQQTGYLSTSSVSSLYRWGNYNWLECWRGFCIVANPALTRLSLPGYGILNSPFKIVDNQNLTNFTVPNLTGVAYNDVALNGTFEHVQFPSMLSCNGTFQIKTSYKKFSCSDFGPFQKACTANAPFGSLGWDSKSGNGYTSYNTHYNDSGFPSFTTGQTIGCIIGSLIGLFLSVFACYCCCCHRCCSERRQKKRRLKLATGTENGLSTADQTNPPEYELRDANVSGHPGRRLENRQRMTADDALDVTLHTRLSTTTSPPEYGDCTNPAMGVQRPPPYHASG